MIEVYDHELPDLEVTVTDRRFSVDSANEITPCRIKIRKYKRDDHFELELLYSTYNESGINLELTEEDIRFLVKILTASLEDCKK